VTSFAQGRFSVSQAIDGERVVASDMTRESVQKGAGAIRGNLKVVPLSELKAWVRNLLK
jgi:hypothetical protein